MVIPSIRFTDMARSAVSIGTCETTRVEDVSLRKLAIRVISSGSPSPTYHRITICRIDSVILQHFVSNATVITGAECSLLQSLQ